MSLVLVNPHTLSEHDREFVPLPFFPWDERPHTLPLDVDECATAIHLARGHLSIAASLLKVAEFKLARFIKVRPYLIRIQSEEFELEASKAAYEYSRALDSDSDRRREWGASRIMASRAAAGHPFSPAPVQPTASQASLSLTNVSGGRTFTFRWRTDADDAAPAPTIDADADAADD